MKIVKSYQQQADYTCGVACVRTILGAFGRRVPSEKALTAVLKPTKEAGTTPTAIIDCLRSSGVLPEGIIRGKVDSLRAWIASGRRIVLIDYADWGGHWVIVCDWKREKGWSGGKFTLADPAAKYEGRPDGFSYICGERLDSIWYDNLPPKTDHLAIVVGPLP